MRQDESRLHSKFVALPLCETSQPIRVIEVLGQPRNGLCFLVRSIGGVSFSDPIPWRRPIVLLETGGHIDFVNNVQPSGDAGGAPSWPNSEIVRLASVLSRLVVIVALVAAHTPFIAQFLNVGSEIGKIFFPLACGCALTR